MAWGSDQSNLSGASRNANRSRCEATTPFRRSTSSFRLAIDRRPRGHRLRASRATTASGNLTTPFSSERSTSSLMAPVLAELLHVFRGVGGRDVGADDRCSRGLSILRSAPAHARLAARRRSGSASGVWLTILARNPNRTTAVGAAAPLVRLPPFAPKLTLELMTRVGFFSGSFDPMTNGHLDVIEHAAALVRPAGRRRRLQSEQGRSCSRSRSG